MRWGSHRGCFVGEAGSLGSGCWDVGEDRRAEDNFVDAKKMHTRVAAMGPQIAGDLASSARQGSSTHLLPSPFRYL